MAVGRIEEASEIMMKLATTNGVEVTTIIAIETFRLFMKHMSSRKSRTVEVNKNM